ncbi:hypothetical protein T484DRAFT_1816202, partial [Baffinella frigidus]
DAPPPHAPLRLAPVVPALPQWLQRLLSGGPASGRKLGPASERRGPPPEFPAGIAARHGDAAAPGTAPRARPAAMTPQAFAAVQRATGLLAGDGRSQPRNLSSPAPPSPPVYGRREPPNLSNAPHASPVYRPPRVASGVASFTPSPADVMASRAGVTASQVDVTASPADVMGSTARAAAPRAWTLLSARVTGHADAEARRSGDTSAGRRGSGGAGGGEGEEEEGEGNNPRIQLWGTPAGLPMTLTDIEPAAVQTSPPPTAEKRAPPPTIEHAPAPSIEYAPPAALTPARQKVSVVRSRASLGAVPVGVGRRGDSLVGGWEDGELGDHAEGMRSSAVDRVERASREEARHWGEKVRNLEAGYAASSAAAVRNAAQLEQSNRALQRRERELEAARGAQQEATTARGQLQEALSRVEAARIEEAQRGGEQRARAEEERARAEEAREQVARFDSKEEGKENEIRRRTHAAEHSSVARFEREAEGKENEGKKNEVRRRTHAAEHSPSWLG